MASIYDEIHNDHATHRALLERIYATSEDKLED